MSASGLVVDAYATGTAWNWSFRAVGGGGGEPGRRAVVGEYGDERRLSAPKADSGDLRLVLGGDNSAVASDSTVPRTGVCWKWTAGLCDLGTGVKLWRDRGSGSSAAASSDAYPVSAATCSRCVRTWVDGTTVGKSCVAAPVAGARAGDTCHATGAAAAGVGCTSGAIDGDSGLRGAAAWCGGGTGGDNGP